MKSLKGKVVSTRMAKTATVLIERKKIHPIYKKGIKTRKKYHAHDELGVELGDTVRIVETRPISKTKRWKIIEIIKN